MKAYFSPSQGVFYPYEMVFDGSYGDSLPGDLIEPTDVEINTYWRTSPPPGKSLGTTQGRPVWVSASPLTKEQMLEAALMQRSQLRIAAGAEIEWRQDAVDEGIATEEEAADLAAWKKYRVLLMRVDTAAPVWPTLPTQ